MDRIITIGREFGSGGRRIGIAVAKALGIPSYDKEIITLAAEHGGLDANFLKEHEEKAPSFGGGTLDFSTFYQPSFSDTIFFEQSEVIRQLAANGPCVIVGRCADYVLRDQNTINIFISAGNTYKVSRKRMLEPEKANLKDAQFERYINDTNKQRRKYYEHYTGRDWGHTENYHLCLASDVVGEEGAVKTILTFLENLKD